MNRYLKYEDLQELWDRIRHGAVHDIDLRNDLRLRSLFIESATLFATIASGCRLLAAGLGTGQDGTFHWLVVEADLPRDVAADAETTTLLLKRHVAAWIPGDPCLSKCETRVLERLEARRGYTVFHRGGIAFAANTVLAAVLHDEVRASAKNGLFRALWAFGPDEDGIVPVLRHWLYRIRCGVHRQLKRLTAFFDLGRAYGWLSTDDWNWVLTGPAGRRALAQRFAPLTHKVRSNTAATTTVDGGDVIDAVASLLNVSTAAAHGLERLMRCDKAIPSLLRDCPVDVIRLLLATPPPEPDSSRSRVLKSLLPLFAGDHRGAGNSRILGRPGPWLERLKDGRSWSEAEAEICLAAGGTADLYEAVSGLEMALHTLETCCRYAAAVAADPVQASLAGAPYRIRSGDPLGLFRWSAVWIGRMRQRIAEDGALRQRWGGAIGMLPNPDAVSDTDPYSAASLEAGFCVIARSRFMERLSFLDAEMVPLCGCLTDSLPTLQYGE